jgi:adenylate kinase family enzyme
MPHIHILGASGAGTSSLGAAVAVSLGIPHLDSDRFYWLPTEPPFTAARPREARVAMLVAAAPADGDWVLSGSAINWAKPLEPLYQLIVYLRLDREVRLARLKAREAARYGARIAPGGDLAAAHAEFMAWAAQYDTAGPELRSRVAHEAWLARQAAPVLRLDAALPVNELVPAVLKALPK